MDVRASLRKPRDGGVRTQDDCEAFIGGYVDGGVPDYQASALLMAIFLHGMEADELFHWTGAMLRSGDVFDFADIAGPKADKHSTGGVGDKVSIPLGPAVAACGLRVPMVSGRGLGHTGGTLDKLEAIPGFRTNLSYSEFRGALERTGVAFGGQTETLVPADRKLYALRDVTGLVESIPLIASSIMSKKLAEGIDALVLDVKFGSGAFLPERERGEELARTMLGIARSFGLRATVYQTSMVEPLGRAVGHTLEIEESLACLAGDGPEDLRTLVTTLGGEMLAASGLAADVDEGARKVAASLDDGSALETMGRIIAEQGGDPRCIDDRSLLAHAPDVTPLTAESAGTLSFLDCRRVGLAVSALGGGRMQLDDVIDTAVGVVWRHKAGDEVAAGDVLCDIHHRAGHGLEVARAELSAAVHVGAPPELPPLVLARQTS